MSRRRASYLPVVAAAGAGRPVPAGAGSKPRAAWPLLVGALFFALLAGLAASTGAPLVAGVLAAAIAGAALLASPRFHIAFAMFFALVATGILEFFFFFGQANWMSSLLVGSGILAAAVHAVGMPGRSNARQGIGWFGVLVGLFLLLLAFSSLLNRIPVGQAIVGVRNYVPYIGVATLLLYCRLQPEFVRKLPLGLLAIGLLQMPFALFQHLVTGPWRAALRNAVGRSDEAIVGTFGGSAVTGGYTGEMAAFLVMCIVFVIALRRERQIGTGLAALMSLVLLVPILLAETKVSLVLLPLLVGVCFVRDALHNPRFFLVALVVGVILVGAIGIVYYLRYWHDSAGAARTLGYSFDPNFMVTRFHRGRVGAIVHWYQMNPGAGQVITAFFGHGMGSSLESSATIGIGSAVVRYGLGLDAHAMARLLWDSGVAGFAVFLLLSLRTFWVARRLARRDNADPLVRASLVFCSGAGLAMTLMLPYQDAVLGGSALQFLFWFCAGFVEYERRRLEAISSPPHDRGVMRAPGVR
jgi:hypothetical protein